MIRDIPGYEGRYVIDVNGNITNIEKERKLSLCCNGKGYLQVFLYKEGKRKKFYAHRLVWSVFNGEVPDGYEIDHRDDNRGNPVLSNLRLVTRKQNLKKMLDRNPHVLDNLRIKEKATLV